MGKGSLIKKLVKRHGSAVRVISHDSQNEWKAHAFIQPIRYRNKRYFDGEFVQGGLVDSRHFLYIGTPDVRVDLIPGAVLIKRDEESYTVRRSEAVFLDRECIYVWAVLQPHVA